MATPQDVDFAHSWVNTTKDGIKTSKRKLRRLRRDRTRQENEIKEEQHNLAGLKEELTDAKNNLATVKESISSTPDDNDPATIKQVSPLFILHIPLVFQCQHQLLLFLKNSNTR